MTGKDKFEESGKKLKEEVQATATAEDMAMAAVKSRLAKLQQDPEVSKMLQQDAQDEAEKSGGQLPILKVFISNKSTDTLADGSEPHNGYFIHTLTQQEYPEVHCHILAISRGFYMPGMNKDKEGKVKNDYQHIVSGIMLNGEAVPFWLFVKGQARVNVLWDFRDELRKYNKIGLPSFPLIVKLTTGKGPDPKPGQSRATVINFEVEKNESGEPMMIESGEEYMMLREKVQSQQEYVDMWITKKEVLKENKVAVSATAKVVDAETDPSDF